MFLYIPVLLQHSTSIQGESKEENEIAVPTPTVTSIYYSAMQS